MSVTSNEKKEKKLLTRKELERVDEIISRYFDFMSKKTLQDELGKTGMSPSEPRLGSSNFKPETIGPKVDEMRRIKIYNVERQAKEMIFSLDVRTRLYLTVWPELRNQINPLTGKKYCRNDMLDFFGCCEKTYKSRTSKAKWALIEVDKSFNPQLHQSEVREVC